MMTSTNKPINQRTSLTEKPTNQFNQLTSVTKLILLFLAISCQLTATAYAADFAGILKSVSITDSGGTNTPPVAVINYTQNGDTVDFDASGSSDADGNIIEYRWDFGGGGSGAGINISQKFTTYGEFLVTLTVVDDAQGVAISQLTVTVSPPVSCVGASAILNECNPSAIPDGIFLKNADRTNVFRWTAPNHSGKINRVKIYFGTPVGGVWADFSNVKVVVYRGGTMVAEAPIAPSNDAWIWSDKLEAVAGQSLSFDASQDIYFGLSVKEPASGIPSQAFGYFNNASDPSFYYKIVYLPVSGTSWGMHTDKQMAAILEYVQE